MHLLLDPGDADRLVMRGLERGVQGGQLRLLELLPGGRILALGLAHLLEDSLRDSRWSAIAALDDSEVGGESGNRCA